MSLVLKRAVLSTVVIGVVTASGAIGLGRGGAVPAASIQATDNTGFPDGDMKKFVLENCGGCHDLDQVKSAKHNEAAWKETLGHMVTYGANMTDAQVPTVAAYLAKSFPVNPPANAPGAPAANTPATPAQKPAEDPDVAGERILNTACTTCHDLGPVVRLQNDRAAWESVVYGMVGNGADVKDAEIPVLVNYLFKTYGPPKSATPATPAAPAGGRGGRGARGQ